ncbi:glycosyltransferase [Paracoccus onubensis]|uniref:Glycosyltransferase n=1 Tax=Paracoccus onubensis TaxID=1675788 RepID=A0A418T3Y2_9RHOB|nr:glycosyltransferase [Paracoccus onubensis]RJE87830.1 glycosyltransferase [Paracoccus onubensis]
MCNDHDLPVAVSPQASKRLQAEIAHIIDIYRVLYPARNLSFVISEGDNPTRGEPSIHEGQPIFRPSDLGAGYLGRVECPGPDRNAPVVTIRVSIPREPSPDEVRHQDPDWRPVRPLGALYAAAPILYEDIRYRAEMRRKRLAGKRHQCISLPFSRGSTLLPAAVEPDSGKAPAILIGMHWLEVGGAEKLGLDSIHWALEAGLRVFVVAGVPSLQRLASKLPDRPDVTFIRLDRYLPDDQWPRYVENLIRAENIRVVHNHHCRQLYDALPQIRVKTPWVKTIDSTHVVEYADGGFPRISGVWSNYIDIHHVISRQLADYYRDRFQILHNVVLGRMLDPRGDQKALRPISMQTAQKSLHITFIGRMYYQKRPIVLVEILRSLAGWAKKADIDLRATIVGEGPYLGPLTQLLRRFGLLDRVALEAADCNVPALLDRSDILLLPSNNEGLALVCYEAVEHGCIPISTDVGAQNEIIPEDLLLPLSPRETVSACAGIVERLWRDKDFLDRQKAALRAAWTRLSADPTAKEVLMPHYRDAAGTVGKG